MVYNNGWVSTCDRNHGHGMYLQNNGITVKLFENNIGFNTFCEGIQVYGEKAIISNMHFKGNVLFNNGVNGGPLTKKNNRRTDQLIVAGGCLPIQNLRQAEPILWC